MDQNYAVIARVFNMFSDRPSQNSLKSIINLCESVFQTLDVDKVQALRLLETLEKPSSQIEAKHQVLTLPQQILCEFLKSNYKNLKSFMKDPGFLNVIHQNKSKVTFSKPNALEKQCTDLNLLNITNGQAKKLLNLLLQASVIKGIFLKNNQYTSLRRTLMQFILDGQFENKHLGEYLLHLNQRRMVAYHKVKTTISLIG